MKILNVMLSKGIGGLESVSVNISEALKLENIEVLNILRENSVIINKFKERNINFTTCKATNFLDLSTSNNIKKFILENKIEIILAHGRRAVDFCYKAKKKFDKTEMKPIFIGWFHNDIDFGLGRITKMDYIFVLNENQRERIESTGFNKEKIIKIQNFLNIDKNESKFNIQDNNKEEKHSFTIGAISRLETQKGFDLLINAFRILIDKKYDLELKIGGGGFLESELRSLTRKLKIEDRVEFVGYIKNVNNFYKNIDIFVNCSKREPFGLNTTGAMYYQVPIVATPTYGSLEIINHMKNGIICEDFSPNSIANSIEYLIKNPEKREIFIKNAKKKSYYEYSYNMLSRKLVGILNSILEKESSANISTKGDKELPVIVKLVSRALVFNSKNEILIVSEDGDNWSIPGGTIEANVELKKLCKDEVYEETGLNVEVLDLFGTYQVSGSTDNGWYKNKYIDCKHIYINSVFVYHCKIEGDETLNKNWVDLAHNVIRFRRFIDEKEFKKLKIWQEFLQNMTFEEIKNTKSFECKTEDRT